MITLETLRDNEAINAYITAADRSLAALGYTEHSYPHVLRVAETAAYILRSTGHEEHEIQLARVAAYLHDIGNLVNRVDHSQSGAVMAFRILDKMDMPPQDLATVVTAIGNHDEGTGVPVDDVAAALILADNSDVRRSRVRNADAATLDIHDRVNYSVRSSKLTVNAENHQVTLTLDVDTAYGSIMDYFEIFLERMVLCRKAAQKLGLDFKLVINGQQLI